MTNAAGLLPVVLDWNDMGAVQAEITRWASAQFPHRTDHHAIYKLMVEEIPEMCDHKKTRGVDGIGPELADCFILLFDLASLWNVDMAEAIRTKMAINYDRTWGKDANGIMQHVPETPLQFGQLTAKARCPMCKSAEHVKRLPIELRHPAAPHDDKCCVDCQITFDSTVLF